MLKKNGKIWTFDGKWLKTYVDPYNPLNLPAGTMRVRTSDGNPPNQGSWAFDGYDHAVLVEGTADVYDIWKDDHTMDQLATDCDNIVECLGANTAGQDDLVHLLARCPNLEHTCLFDTSSATNLAEMYYKCPKLVSVPLYDTSNATNLAGFLRECSTLTEVPQFDTSSAVNMSGMFEDCRALTYIPDLNTSNATNMEHMFRECRSLAALPNIDTSNVESIYAICYNCFALKNIPLWDTSKMWNVGWAFAACGAVQSGAYDLYVRMSTQTAPPSYHERTFFNCGDSGNIPADWKYQS